jgi:hypothetical protein
LLIQDVFGCYGFRRLESAFASPCAGLSLVPLNQMVYWRAGFASARSFLGLPQLGTKRFVMDSIAKLALAAIAFGLWRMLRSALWNPQWPMMITMFVKYKTLSNIFPTERTRYAAKSKR